MQDRTNCWVFRRRIRLFERSKAAFRAPSFSNASFVYDGKTLDLTSLCRTRLPAGAFTLIILSFLSFFFFFFHFFSFI